jgi:hypothetical protein
MFLNVDMMLLPPRGYRQGCHRSPTWTAIPIVIGIVLGSHRHIFIVCFGPSSMGRPFLIYGPSQLGLILILMSQSSGCSAGAMVSAMTFPALGRRSWISMCTGSPFVLLHPPIYLKVEGSFPFPSLYICIKEGVSPDCTRLFPIFPMPLFTWGPTC